MAETTAGNGGTGTGEPRSYRTRATGINRRPRDARARPRCYIDVEIASPDPERSMDRWKMTMCAVVCALWMVLPAPAAGQTPAAAPDPADVETLDGILAAVYESISGPAGAPRDWDRFRTLMADGARLIPTGRSPGGTAGMRVLTPEEYIELADPGLVQGGFFETEVGRVVERYGAVVHLMSAYESRRAADDPEPFQRGVNSFQLLDDGTRWWVVTIFWAGETPDTPIPDRFLGGIGG